MAPPRNLTDEQQKWLDEFRSKGYHQSGGIGERMITKTKQNPFVPIGCLMTVAALTMGLRAMYHGNSRNSQLFMRARVLAQGFTIAALIGGLAYSGLKS